MYFEAILEIPTKKSPSLVPGYVGFYTDIYRKRSDSIAPMTMTTSDRTDSTAPFQQIIPTGKQSGNELIPVLHWGESITTSVQRSYDIQQSVAENITTSGSSSCDTTAIPVDQMPLASDDYDFSIFNEESAPLPNRRIRSTAVEKTEALLPASSIRLTTVSLFEEE